jgi:poly(3-hydroxybutyrate) depolymerase
MPKIPPVNGTCPMLTGLSGTTVTINGQTAVVWSGTMQSGQGAPLVFYWHGTGSTPQEAGGFFGTETQEVVGKGGLVASFESTTGTGTNTSGTAIFYSDDYNTADQILACAVQQLNIDTTRIISTGCSAGGLQTGNMVYYRSSYLACAMPNSGGTVFPGMLQDSHVPSLITTHGAAGADVVGVDFSMTSLSEDMDIKSKAASSMPPGGYVVDCNHGGGHCGAPADDVAAQWQFCKDHPFGVSPDPYGGKIPSNFPTYCTYQ